MANEAATAAAPPSRTLPLAAALKDAVLSGAVAFGLFFFMIGLRTEQGSTGALEITTRFQTFAVLVPAHPDLRPRRDPARPRRAALGGASVRRRQPLRRPHAPDLRTARAGAVL